MKTVGEILQKARVEKKYDFETIERRTRIRKKFLTALEENDWSAFHSTTYIKGFLRNYSNFLGLKPEEMVAVFRRQYTEDELAKGIPKDIAESLQEPIFRITPQKTVILTTIVFIVIFISYLIFQYRAFTGTPTLKLDTPKEGEVYTNATITVSGSTDKDAELFINSQKVEIDSNGHFKQDLTLNVGIDQLIIESRSKLGKKTKITRTIQVTTP